MLPRASYRGRFFFASAALTILLGVAGPLLAAEDGCRLSRLAAEGSELIVIENAYVALTLAPARGGSCAQLLYKPTGATWTGPGNDIRMMADMVWSPRNARE